MNRNKIQWGHMSVIPFRRRLIPYRFFNANYLIIGLNLLFFMIIMLAPHVLLHIALNPVVFFNDHQYWQLISFHLVHVEILPLVFNLIGLLFFGPQVEREMGSIEYLLFYWGIGIVAGLLSVFIFDGLGLVYSIFGAAIPVFAILMAFAAFYPDTIIYLMGIFPLRAPRLILVFIGIEVLILLISGRWQNLVSLTGIGLSALYIFMRYRSNPFRYFFK